MKNIRFTAIFLLKFLQRYNKIVSLAVVVLILIIGIFIKGHGKLFKQSISEGAVGTYTENDLPELVTNLVSQGLVSLDASGVAGPGLAASWQVNTDATEYTFKLKPNLYWIDGSKVKASDFDFSIPDTKVSAVDDSTIKFKLNDSFSPLPTLLSKPVLKKGSKLGVGPYQISKIDEDSVFVTKVKLTSPDPTLPDITIRFYPNERTAEEALNIGEIQSFFGAGKIDDFTGKGPFEIVSRVNHSRLVTIFYNNQDSVLSDKNFRLGLSFAAPSIKNEETAITSLPSTSWAFNSQVRDYLDNSDQAKTYLAKVKNGRDSTITLTSTTTLADVGQQVVKEWNKEGIKAVLKVESGIPQNFQALLISQDIPIDPDQYSLWHSTQTQTNVSKYSSPRIDKDLEDGRKLTDQNTRKAKYQDFQKVLLDDSPATFLYFPKYNVIALKKIDPALQKVIKYQLVDLAI